MYLLINNVLIQKNGFYEIFFTYYCSCHSTMSLRIKVVHRLSNIIFGVYEKSENIKINKSYGLSSLRCFRPMTFNRYYLQDVSCAKQSNFLELSSSQENTQSDKINTKRNSLIQNERERTSAIQHT